MWMRIKGCRYSTEEGNRELRDNTGDWAYQGFANLASKHGFDEELYQEHYDAAAESENGHAPYTEYAKAMTELTSALVSTEAFACLRRSAAFTASMKYLALLTIALAGVLHCAGQTSPKDTIMRELIQLYEIDQMMTEAKKAAGDQASGVAQQMFDRFKSGLPGLSDDVWKKITEAADKMIARVNDSWSVDDALSVWQAEFSADLSIEELHQILDASRTPLGRKQIAASKRAVKAFQTYMLSKNKTLVEAAMKEYVKELQQIIAGASTEPKS
jgi:hypothetical protein